MATRQDRKGSKTTCIGVLGDSGVGKTALVQRFADSAFEEKYNPTKGVAGRAKYDEVNSYRILDASGSQRHLRVVRMTLKTALGSLVCFEAKGLEAQGKKAFESVQKWIDEALSLSGEKIVLVACQCEDASLEDLRIARGFAKELSLPICETSAKENINVSKAFEILCESIEGKKFVHEDSPIYPGKGTISDITILPNEEEFTGISAEGTEAKEGAAPVVQSLAERLAGNRARMMARIQNMKKKTQETQIRSSRSKSPLKRSVSERQLLDPNKAITPPANLQRMTERYLMRKDKDFAASSPNLLNVPGEDTDQKPSKRKSRGRHRRDKSKENYRKMTETVGRRVPSSITYGLKGLRGRNTEETKDVRLTWKVGDDVELYSIVFAAWQPAQIKETIEKNGIERLIIRTKSGFTTKMQRMDSGLRPIISGEYDDSEDRKNWKPDHIVEVYSSTRSGWTDAKIISITEEEGKDWLKIQYQDGGGMKEVLRNDCDLIRPLPGQIREKLKKMKRITTDTIDAVHKKRPITPELNFDDDEGLLSRNSLSPAFDASEATEIYGGKVIMSSGMKEDEKSNENSEKSEKKISLSTPRSAKKLRKLSADVQMIGEALLKAVETSQDTAEKQQYDVETMKTQLEEKENMIKELERKLKEMSEKVDILSQKNGELKETNKQLADKLKKMERQNLEADKRTKLLNNAPNPVSSTPKDSPPRTPPSRRRPVSATKSAKKLSNLKKNDENKNFRRKSWTRAKSLLLTTTSSSPPPRQRIARSATSPVGRSTRKVNLALKKRGRLRSNSPSLLTKTKGSRKLSIPSGSKLKLNIPDTKGSTSSTPKGIGSAHKDSAHRRKAMIQRSRSYVDGSRSVSPSLRRRVNLHKGKSFTEGSGKTNSNSGPPSPGSPRKRSVVVSSEPSILLKVKGKNKEVIENKIEINQKVRCRDKRVGYVRFIGPVHYAAGKWIGIQLEEKSGKADGIYKGKKYFECDRGHGLMIRVDKRPDSVGPLRD